MYPISIMWYLRLGRKHFLSSWRAKQYFYSQSIFLACLQKKETVFRIICIKKAGNHLYNYSCHLIFESFSEQMNLKKKIWLLFVQTYQKIVFTYGTVTWQWPKRERTSLYGNVSGQWPKMIPMYITNCSTKIILKLSITFQLPAFYFVRPWLTTLLFLWTNLLVPTVWTLANDKTDSDNFLGQNTIPATWM